MNNIPKTRLAVLAIVFCALVLGPIAIGFGGDIYDLNHGLLWTSFAKRLQWESILAGALGLAGGVFVIYSTRKQIEATEQATQETLQQAKLHRADELNAPLQLARDVVDETHTWANDTIEHIDGLLDTLRAPSTDARNLQKACMNAKANIIQRCKYIDQIAATHQTTSFSFEVTSRLRLLVATQNIKRTAAIHNRHPGIRDDERITYQMLIETRTRSAGARTEIDRQMVKVRERCGVSNA